MNYATVCIFPVGRQLSRNKFAYIVASCQLIKSSRSKKIGSDSSYISKVLRDRLKRVQLGLSTEWAEWQSADQSTLKGKLYAYFLKGKSMIDPHELFMVELSDAYRSNSPVKVQLKLVYPSHINEENARAEVVSMLDRLIAQSVKYSFGYALLLPVSLLASVIPGPNIFLIANILRLNSLRLTHTTATTLLRCMHDEKPESTGQLRHEVLFIPSSDLNMNCFNWLESAEVNKCQGTYVSDAITASLLADINTLVDSMHCDPSTHDRHAVLPAHILDEARRVVVRSFCKFYGYF